jgi:hypothetical protein
VGDRQPHHGSRQEPSFIEVSAVANPAIAGNRRKVWPS